MFGWWSHFTAVLPLMVFSPAWHSYRYLCVLFPSSNVRMMEWSVYKRTMHSYSFLDWLFSRCAEPSLCSGGTCARASPWRTYPGYVCCTRREDLPHRCPHGGSGTSSTELINSQQQTLAATGIIVHVGFLGT